MWKGPGEDPGGPEGGGGGGTKGAASQQELQDLKDQYEQQQTLIAQLKEMLRKTDQTTINQEKVAEYANTLTKMNARAKRSQQKEGRDETRSGQGSRRGETPASEKVMLLRQQLEQNRVKLAERGKSQKGMEDMVTQIKAQLDDSQQHFAITQTPLNISLIDDRVDYTPNTTSQELYNILLNKDKRISDLNGKVSRLEANVLDLQENIKEKDSVIDARTKAITLMSENLSKKGKTTLDTLDETKEQMRTMQENFVKMEEEMKVQHSKLKLELEEREREAEDLKVENERLTTRNKELESGVDNVDSSLISRLQHRISELEELNSKTVDDSVILNPDDALVQLQQRVNELEGLNIDSQKRINELEELNGDSLVQQLQERISELEELTSKSESSESPQNTSKSRKSKKGKQQKQSDNASVKISELESTIQERDTKIAECNKLIESLQKEIDEHTIDEKLKTIEDLQTLNAELTEKVKMLENSVTVVGVGEEHPDVVKLRQQLEEGNKNMIKIKAQNKSKVKELNRRIDQFKKIGDLNAAVVRLEAENSKHVQKIAELEEEKGQMQLNMVESKESINLDEVKDLEDRLKEYLEEIANKNSRIATLEHDNEENDTKITELLEKIEDLTNTQNAQIKSDLTSVQYEEQLEKLEVEKKRIIDEKETENQNLLEQIENVKKEKLDVTNKLDSYMQENIELMDRLEKLSAEKVSSAESIEIVENLTQQEKLELEAYQKNLAIDDKSAENLNESVSQLTEETSELLQKIELFTVERREVMEKMEALTVENNQLNSKLKEVENNRDILAETYEQLQTEKEELDLRLQSNGVEEYKALIEIQKQEITELRLKVLSHGELYETNRGLMEEVEDLTRKNRDFEVRNADLEKRMRDFEDKLRNSLDEIEVYKSVIEEGKSELIASSSLIGDLQKKLKEKTLEIEHYENDLNHLSSVIADLNSLVETKVDTSMDVLSEQLEKLKSSLNENLKTIEDHERELNENSTTIKDLNSNLKNLNDRIVHLGISLEEKDGEIAKIAKEKSELEEVNRKLEESILEKEKTFHSTCQELKNRCLSLQKQIENNSESFGPLQLKVEALEKKNKEQFEKMKKIAANLKKKTVDCKELERELEKLKPRGDSEIENLESQLREKIEVIESLEELLKEKSKMIEILESQSQESSHVVEILETQLQEKSKFEEKWMTESREKSQLEETWREKAKLIEDLQSELLEKTKAVEKAQNDLQVKSKLVKKLQEKQKLAEKTEAEIIKQLKNEIQEQSAFSNTLKLLETAQPEETWESELQEKSNLIENLQSELSEMSKSLEKSQNDLRLKSKLVEKLQGKRIASLESIPTENMELKAEDVMEKMLNVMAELQDKIQLEDQQSDELEKLQRDVHEKIASYQTAEKQRSELIETLENEVQERSKLIKKLKIKLQEKIKAGEKSKQEHEEKLRQVAEKTILAEKLLEKWEQEFIEKSKLSETLQQDLHATTQLLENARRDLQEKSEMIENLQRDSAESERKTQAILKYSAKVEDLQNIIREYENHVGQLSNELETLRSVGNNSSNLELSRKDELIAELTARLETLTSLEHASDALKMKINELEMYIEMQDSELGRHKEKVEKLEEGLSKVEERRKSLENQTIRLGAELREKDEDFEKHAQNEDFLELRLKTLAERDAAIEVSLKETMVENQNLASQNQHLLGQLETIKRQLENAERKLEDTSSDAEKLDALEGENSQLHHALSGVENELKKANSELKNLKYERERNESELQEQLEQYSVERKLLMEQCELSSEQVNALSQTRDELQAEISDLVQKLDQQQLDFEENIRKYQRLETQHKETLSELEEVNDTFSKMDQEHFITVAELNQTLSATLGELESKKRSVGILRQQIQFLKEQRDRPVDSVCMKQAIQTDDKNKNSALFTWPDSGNSNDFLLTSQNSEAQKTPQMQNISAGEMNQGGHACDASKKIHQIDQSSPDFFAGNQNVDASTQNYHVGQRTVQDFFAGDRANDYSSCEFFAGNQTENSNRNFFSENQTQDNLIRAKNMVLEQTLSQGSNLENQAAEIPIQQTSEIPGQDPNLEYDISESEMQTQPSINSMDELKEKIKTLQFMLFNAEKERDTALQQCHQLSDQIAQLVYERLESQITVEESPSDQSPTIKVKRADLTSSSKETPVEEQMIQARKTFVCYKDDDDIFGESEGWGAEESIPGENPEIKTLQAKIMVLELERQNHSEELKQAQIKSGKLIKKLKEFKLKNEQLTSKLKSDDCGDLNEAIQDELKAQISTLEKRIKERDAEKHEKENLLKRIDVLTAANERMIEMKEKQDIEMLSWQHRNRDLTLKLEQMEWGDEKFTEKVVKSETTSANQELLDTIKELTLDNEDLQALLEEQRNLRLEAERAKATQVIPENVKTEFEYNLVLGERNSLQEKVDQLEKLLEAQNVEAAGAQTKLEQLNLVIAEKEKINADLIRTKDQLKMEQEKLKETTQQLQTNYSEKTQLEATILESNITIESLNCQLNELRPEIGNMQTELEASISKIDALHVELERCESARGKIAAEKVELENALELLNLEKSTLEQAKVENEVLTAALDQLKLEKSILEQNMQERMEMMTALEQHRHENDRAVSDIEGLKREVVQQKALSQFFDDAPTFDLATQESKPEHDQLEQLKLQNEHLSASLEELKLELERVKLEKARLEELKLEKSPDDLKQQNEQLKREKAELEQLRPQNDQLIASLEQLKLELEFLDDTEQIATENAYVQQMRIQNHTLMASLESMKPDKSSPDQSLKNAEHYSYAQRLSLENHQLLASLEQMKLEQMQLGKARLEQLKLEKSSPVQLFKTSEQFASENIYLQELRIQNHLLMVSLEQFDPENCSVEQLRIQNHQLIDSLKKLELEFERVKLEKDDTEQLKQQNKQLASSLEELKLGKVEFTSLEQLRQETSSAEELKLQEELTILLEQLKREKSSNQGEFADKFFTSSADPFKIEKESEFNLQNEELRNLLSTKETENLALQQTLELLTQEKEELRSLLDNKDAELNVTVQQWSAHVDQRGYEVAESWKLHLESRETEFMQLEQQLRKDLLELEGRCRLLLDENKELRKSVDDEIRGEVDRISNLQKEINAKDVEIGEMVNAQKVKQDEIETMQVDISNYTRIISELNMKIQELERKEMTVLKSEHNLEIVQDEVEEELVGKDRIIQGMQEEINVLKSVTEKESDHERLINKLQIDVKEKENDLQESKLYLEDARHQIEQFKLRASNLDVSLKEKDDTINELNATVEASRINIIQLQQHVSEQQQQINMYSVQLQENYLLTETLQQELENYKSVTEHVQSKDTEITRVNNLLQEKEREHAYALETKTLALQSVINDLREQLNRKLQELEQNHAENLNNSNMMETLYKNQIDEFVNTHKTQETEYIHALQQDGAAKDVQLSEFQSIVRDDEKQLLELKGIIEEQVIKIEELKHELFNKSNNYDALVAQLDIPHDLQTPGQGEDVAEPASRAELDLALYMLHQRDVRCEELTVELVQLLEERDTLQLRLSNALREKEELKARLDKFEDDVPELGVARKVVASSGAVPKSKAIILGATGTELAAEATENLTDGSLANKLSELKSVGYRKDKTIVDEQALRRIQQLSILQEHKDEVSKLPPEAAARLLDASYTLSDLINHHLFRQGCGFRGVKLAERGKSQKGMEDMVTQIKAQLDDSQQHFTITQTPLNISLIDDRVDYTPNTTSQELYNILLNKDKRISDLNGKVSRLEANVLDLQENIKEKDSVIDARTKAITLMSENLSKKGKTTLDTLDETKEQMRTMQENFVKMEEEMKVQHSKLKLELEEREREVEDLKVENERLTTRNKELESGVDNVDSSLISRLQHRIGELEELKSKTVDDSVILNPDYALVQLQLRVNELEELNIDSQKRINELEELNGDSLVQQLQERISELEELTSKSESSESPQNTSKSRKSKKGKQQKQSDNASVKISELESAIQERDTKIAECNKLIESLQKEIDEHKTIDEKLKTIEDLQTLNAELTEKVKMLENSVTVVGVGEEHPDVVKLRQQLEEGNKNMIKIKAQNKSKVKELNRRIDQFKKIGDLNAAVVRLEAENSKHVQKIAELEEEKGQMQLNMVESKESINLDEVKDLEDRLKEYLEEIANKNSRIATLEHDNEENDTKITELLEKIEDLTNTQNAQIKSDLTSVQYEEQLEKLEVEKKRIIDEKETENQNLLEQIENVKKEKLDVTNKLDSYMQENIELMDRLEKLSAEKVSSAESIEIVENLTQQEKLELEAYQKNLAIDDKSAENLNESVSQLTEETSELLQKIELFTVERREVMEKMEALTVENNQLNSKLKEVENNRDILAETYEQLQTEKEELDLRLQSNGVEEYKALIEIQKQEITELRLKVLSHGELYETNRGLMEEVEDLTRKNRDFEVRNADLEKRMRDFEDKLRNSLDEIEVYKSVIEEGKSELIASSSLIGDLQKKLKEKTLEIEHYENDLNHLSSVIADLNSLVETKVDTSMDVLSEQLEKLKSSLNENLKTIEDHERELNENSTTIKDLNSNLKNLNDRIVHLGISLEEKDGEIAKIAKEKSELEEVNRKLEESILEKEKTFHATCQELKNRCLSLQKQIENNSESFGPLQLKVEALEKKNKEQFEKMKKIAANLKKKTVDCKELERELEKLKPRGDSEIENLESQLREKIEVIESLEELLKEKSKMIEILESQSQESSHVVEILETQLQEKSKFEEKWMTESREKSQLEETWREKAKLIEDLQSELLEKTKAVEKAQNDLQVKSKLVKKLQEKQKLAEKTEAEILKQLKNEFQEQSAFENRLKLLETAQPEETWESELQEKSNLIENLQSELSEMSKSLEKSQNDLRLKSKLVEKFQGKRIASLESIPTENMELKAEDVMEKMLNVMAELQDKIQLEDQQSDQLEKLQRDVHEKIASYQTAEKQRSELIETLENEVQERSKLIKKLKIKLQEKIKAGEKSKQEHEEKLRQVAEKTILAEKLLEKWEQEFIEKSKLSETLQQDLHATTQLLENARHDLQEKSEMIENLQRDSAESERKTQAILKYSAKVEDLQNIIREYENHVGQLSNELETLRSVGNNSSNLELSRKDELIAELTARLETLTSLEHASDALKMKINELEMYIEMQDSELGRHKEKVEKLEEGLSKVEERRKSLENQTIRLGAELREKDEDFEKHAQNEDFLELRLKTLAERDAAIEVSLKETMVENQNLASQNQHLLGQLEIIKRQLENAERKLEDTSSDAEKLDALEGENSQLHHALSGVENELKKANSELKNLKYERERNESELQEQLEQYSVERKLLMEQCELSSEQVNALSQTRDELQAEISDLVQKLDQQQLDFEENIRKYQRLETQHKETLSELEEVNDTFSKMDQEHFITVAELNQTLSATLGELESKKRSVGILRQQIEFLKEQRDRPVDSVCMKQAIQTDDKNKNSALFTWPDSGNSNDFLLTSQNSEAQKTPQMQNIGAGEMNQGGHACDASKKIHQIDQSPPDFFTGNQNVDASTQNYHVGQRTVQDFFSGDRANDDSSCEFFAGHQTENSNRNFFSENQTQDNLIRAKNMVLEQTLSQGSNLENQAAEIHIQQTSDLPRQDPNLEHDISESEMQAQPSINSMEELKEKIKTLQFMLFNAEKERDTALQQCHQLSDQIAQLVYERLESQITVEESPSDQSPTIKVKRADLTSSSKETPVEEQMIQARKTFVCYKDDDDIFGESEGWGAEEAIPGENPEIKTLQAKIMVLELERQNQSEELKQAQIKSGKLIKKLKEFKLKNEQLTSKLKSDDCGDLNEAIQDELKAQISTLEKRIKEHEAEKHEKENLLKRIDVLTAANERMIEMKEKQDIEMLSWQHRNRDLTLKLEQMEWGDEKITEKVVKPETTSANQELLDAIKELTLDNEDLQALLEEQRNLRLEAERAKVTQVIPENVKTEFEYNLVLGERNSLQEKVDQLEKLLEAQNVEAAGAQTKLEQLNLVIAEKEKINADLIRTKDQLKMEQEKLKETTQQLQTNYSEKTQLEATILESNITIESLNCQLNELRPEIGNMQTELEASISKIDALHVELERCESARGKIAAEKEELENALELLNLEKSTLEQAKVENEVLTAALDQLKLEKSILEQNMQERMEMMTALEQHRHENDRAVSDIEGLKREVVQQKALSQFFDDAPTFDLATQQTKPEHDQLEQLKLQNEHLSASLEQLKLELERVKLEKARLEELKLEKSPDDHLKQQNEQLKREKAELEQLRPQNDQLIASLEQLKLELEFQDDTEQIATESAYVQQMRIQNHTLMASLEAMKPDKSSPDQSLKDAEHYSYAQRLSLENHQLLASLEQMKLEQMQLGKARLEQLKLEKSSPVQLFKTSEQFASENIYLQELRIQNHLLMVSLEQFDPENCSVEQLRIQNHQLIDSLKELELELERVKLEKDDTEQLKQQNKQLASSLEELKLGKVEFTSLEQLRQETSSAEELKLQDELTTLLEQLKREKSSNQGEFADKFFTSSADPFKIEKESEFNLQNEELRNLLSTKETENLALQQTLELLTQEKEELRSLLDNKDAELNVTVQQWSAHVDQRGYEVAESWKLHLESRETEFMQLEQQLRKDLLELEGRCRLLLDENKELRKSVDDEIRGEVDRISNLQKEINAKDVEIGEMVNAQKVKQDEIETMQVDISNYTRIISELNMKIQELERKEMTVLKSEHNLEIVQDEVEEELVGKDRIIQGMQEEINVLKSVTEKESDHERLINKLQIDVKEKENDLQESKLYLEDARHQIEQFKLRASNLDVSLKEKDDTINELNATVEASRINIIQLQQHVSEQQQQINMYSVQLQENYLLTETLQQELENYKSVTEHVQSKDTEITRVNNLLQEKEREHAYALETKTLELQSVINDLREQLNRKLQELEQNHAENLNNSNLMETLYKNQIDEFVNTHKTQETEYIHALQQDGAAKDVQLSEFQSIVRDDEKQLLELKGIIEEQVIKIEELKHELFNKSNNYDALVAQLDIPHDLQTPGQGEDVAEPASRAELDLALYMLHQRDVRCEELTVELVQLLEERDTLQLRLSNALREKEELKARLDKFEDDVPELEVARKVAASSGAVPKSKAIILGATGTELAAEATENLTDGSLANKLSELKSVGYRKDKTIVDEQALRRIQQLSILQEHKDEVSKLPPEAAARLLDASYTLSRDVQSPSKVLLNWLWGRSTPKVNNI